MAKIKTYKVSKAGSADIGIRLYATCITKACKKFIKTLDRTATYELDSTEQASIRYTDNHCVMGDYVIQQCR